jgi:hypothetical protein
LRIEVGVDVDEARRDDAAFGVDLVGAPICDGSDCRDPVTVDGDIADRTGCAGSVNDEPVSDYKVVCHVRSVPRIRKW